METIDIGGPDMVASRIALGTWAIMSPPAAASVRDVA